MCTRGSFSAAKWPLLALLLCFCSLSCSGGDALHPVHGKVLHKDQPVKGVLVSFHPKGADLTTHRPVGLTREDGSFTLTTGQKEGAPAGEYVVTFICSEEADTKGKKVISTAPPDTVDRFRGAYANHATSEFKVEIKKGVNQLEPFRLK
jgi:hypothetical protein